MLDIVKEPTPSLRERSKELDQDFLLSDEVQQLITEMIPTMYQDDGIGLAAPQVGKNVRICVIGKEANLDSEEDLVLINPVWQKTSRRKFVDIEGCLSVPKTFGKVKRYKSIHVEALNRKGERIEFEAKDFLARVIQHEVDHLDGILFIDKAKDIYTTE
ncbi:peptide deformylase [Candidatus Parcubacteria bacterium]|nr:MAG: peptide deformylase [Candidatus Parcubacteria bacterium]